MTTFNPFRRLAALFPPEPLMLAQVKELDLANNLSRVEYPQGTPVAPVAPGVSAGSTSWARGSSWAIDTWVWVRGGTIEAEAPSGSMVQVEVGGPKDDPFGVQSFAWNGPVPAATFVVGSAFSLDVLSYCVGGTEPYSLTMTGGSLPPGISLNGLTFALTGTPTDPGAYGATFDAEDAEGAIVPTGYVRLTSGAGGGGGSLLPTIADDNATFNDEGDATAGWTTSNATLSVSGSVLRQTKNAAGSSSSMAKALSFTPASKDYILYGKAKASYDTNHIGVIWFLNGSKEVSIWFGSSGANTAYNGGAVSICGTTGASTRNVAIAALGTSYNTTGIEFALHFDSKWNRLNCYFKESGKWRFKVGVNCDWFSSTEIRVLNTTGTPAGGWVEVDYLTLCKPNIVSIGDSICEGKTLHAPNPALGLTNNTNTWQYHAPIYATLRNNLIVNKGVGAQTSAQIASRMAADATDHGPRVVFLHASSNDEGAAISKATRSTNIQSSINTVTGAGAECVLLNAMYGTAAGADNTPTPDLRDYMLDWWANYSTSLTGLALRVNIMSPLLSGGFMDASLTEADGIHPTAFGYQDIGDLLVAT